MSSTVSDAGPDVTPKKLRPTLGALVEHIDAANAMAAVLRKGVAAENGRRLTQIRDQLSAAEQGVCYGCGTVRPLAGLTLYIWPESGKLCGPYCFQCVAGRSTHAGNTPRRSAIRSTSPAYATKGDLTYWRGHRQYELDGISTGHMSGDPEERFATSTPVSPDDMQRAAEKLRPKEADEHGLPRLLRIRNLPKIEGTPSVVDHVGYGE